MNALSLLVLFTAHGAAPAPSCGIETWVPFRWIDGKESAMMVGATVNGKQTWFQFDTGSDTSILYGKRVAKIFGTQPVEPQIDPNEIWHTVTSFSFDGSDPRPQQMLWLQDMQGGRHFAGTLGSDLLIGQTLVIDYPNTRFAVLDASQSARLSGDLTSVPAEVRINKLFVPVVSGGKTYPDVFFDTGSSTFDLWVDKSLWTALTGLSEPKEDGHFVTGRSWGVTYQYPGAPASDLSIAGVPLSDPMTYYRDAEPVFESYPHPAVGLFGNRPFFEKIVVADYGERPSFGFLRCP
jgi:hypothetical protein